MEEHFKRIAALIGDPVRSSILLTLMDGRARTATELAVRIDTSPQNMSMHLAKLLHADLLQVESQGRHRYFTFSRKEVAQSIEAIACLVPSRENKNGQPEDFSDIKYCRTCYDHLAGKIGVALTEQLVKQKIIFPEGTQYGLTKKGAKWFDELGVDLIKIKSSKRVFARACLDWSERKHHLAGALGAALLDKMFLLGWLKKNNGSRAVGITSKGLKGLHDKIKLII